MSGSEMFSFPSAEAAGEMGRAVDGVAGKLASREVEKLDQLRSSRSLQKIVRQLEHKQSQEGKYGQMIQGLHARREDLQVGGVAQPNSPFLLSPCTSLLLPPALRSALTRKGPKKARK